MQVECEKIMPLLDYIKIDKSVVACHFKCPVSKKKIVSTVAFEPYDGKIVLSWKDYLLHPLKSYNRYLHTPIVIYSQECEKSIVLKAFKQVASAFIWDENLQLYRLKEL